MGIVGVAVYVIVRPLWLGARSIVQIVNLALGRLRLGVSTSGSFLTHTTSTFVTYLWRGVSAITSPIRLGISTIFGFLETGTSIVVASIGTGLRHIRRALTSVTRYLSVVASRVALLLWTGMVAVLRPVWLRASTAAQATGAGLRYGMEDVFTILGFLRMGIVVVAQMLGMVLGHTGSGLAAVTASLGMAALTVAGLLWTGVVAVLRPVWLGASTVAQATGAGLRYGMEGVLTILGFLRMGIVAVA